jgi:hypothetical protein
VFWKGSTDKEVICCVYRARILKHFKVTAKKIALGKVNFSNGILKQPDFSLTAVLPLWPGDLFFSYWTECSNVSHPSRKTACVFKNPKNAGMVRKIFFQAKSCLLNLHEMFKNSGSGCGVRRIDWTVHMNCKGRPCKNNRST